MESRVRKVRYLFILFLIFLCIRILNIQAITGREYSTAAAVQRFRNVEIYEERGDFLDRNGIKMTSRSMKTVTVIQPDTLMRNPPALRLLADIMKTSENDLKASLSSRHLPYTAEVSPGQAEAIADAGLDGLSVVEVWDRNSDQTLATHILGYVDEKGSEGLAGLEKIYQNTLTRGGGVYTGVLADAGNSVMENYGYRIWNAMGQEKLNIRTTLDFHMQKIVEETMDRMMDKGAVAVVDILNGDILAMASRPDFDPSRVNPSLQDENQPLFNRALGEYTPGSIFKIVTAAAALEKGITPDLTFECPGYADLNGLIMKCWRFEHGGHGTLNLAQAFSESCNTYFINLGLKVGRDDILDMAEKLGLGRKTGINRQGIPEPAGLLPNTINQASAAEIGNLSIGQGDLLVSPVQAANLTAVIANGGILNKLNLIDCIVNDNGDRIRNIKEPSWQRVLSRETAMALQGMMLMTVESGTGEKASIQGYGGSAGKTGSAETGWIKDDREVLHAWFAGYFPIDAPRYAMCVFIEDGTSGASSAAPVFAEISARIMDLGY